MPKLTDDLEVFCYKIYNGPTKDIDKNWKAFFTCYLKFIGFNPKAIKELFQWGSDGHNWDALHIENTEYANEKKDKLLQSFCSEVEYIYDRISLDRLFRAHWLYNQYKQAKK